MFALFDDAFILFSPSLLLIFFNIAWVRVNKCKNIVNIRANKCIFAMNIRANKCNNVANTRAKKCRYEEKCFIKTH